ncbi:hypothetical protein BamIOP4010DRAFT_6702 [Burkholderia ambifaria IOP40-10]|uniref:Uncharacterized protein n=1 Tax=Burkholderia ambifaria IOP40-10 TaxID=396596 RepID=B1FRN9_9BURK|nr:hypothetical protein BamIOP4010DRAFT_6702 [Burkholderia ambifaria IOP40-10]
MTTRSSRTPALIVRASSAPRRRTGSNAPSDANGRCTVVVGSPADAALAALGTAAPVAGDGTAGLPADAEATAGTAGIGAADSAAAWSAPNVATDRTNSETAGFMRGSASS